MITKQKYVEYLVSTPINYTCSNLAEHLEGMSHDVVSDFLKRERLTASHLWELVEEQIDDSADAYLILDDSVQDKRYARSIEMVKLQYSGAEGGLVRGIGVVNLVHTSGRWRVLSGRFPHLCQRGRWEVKERPFSRDAAASGRRQTD